MVEHGGGGEVHDTGKVLILQIICRVQAAALQKGILNAGSHGILKAKRQIQLIQFL